MPETRAVEELEISNRELIFLPKNNTRTCNNWKLLPYELWLMILVRYGLKANNLASLECSCKWFNSCLTGLSITEESARLIIKRRKKEKFGELVNRVPGSSWKEKLHRLELVEKRLQNLAAGSYQNIFVCNSHLLTWGAGKFGQLGNNQREDSVQLRNIQNLIPPESGQPIQVSAGCGHTGFVTSKGHAFTFGDNRYNQLGHSDFQGETCCIPIRVCKELSSKKCVQIACGSSHTLFLTDTGKVYVTGIGDSGQLGIGTRRGIAIEPILIPFQYGAFNIIQIATGIAHNSCGKVFTFGLGSGGQLGHGGTKNIPQPTLVSVLRNKTIRCGTAGVSHSIFVDAEGKAYTCGIGKGLLGHGDTRIRPTPVLVSSLQGVKIVSAAAGVSQSIFIDSEGAGYWCGEGMGAFKNQVMTLPTRMNLPEALEKASIGSFHAVLQMRSGCLMTIGNNQRFQTGIPTQTNQDIISNYTSVKLNAF